jgi:hypothetical protein
VGFKLRWLALAAFAVALGTYGVWCGVEGRHAQVGVAKLEALLRGDPTPQLESVEIDYQQRRVRCSDPDALRYLERCFREGDKRPGLGGGTWYRLRLRFAGGGQVDATTYWSDNRFRLYMPYQEPDTGEEPRVRVAFRPSVPVPVAEMLAFLDRPWQEVKGVVLVVEPGGVRREFERSLVAE